MTFQNISDRPGQSYMTICDGGGDNVIAGIGGTGISNSGTINGFGSIFVKR
jgi:hypothetical protein